MRGKVVKAIGALQEALETAIKTENVGPLVALDVFARALAVCEYPALAEAAREMFAACMAEEPEATQ